jgi:ABC-type Fe3+ transport system permease subunit
VVLVIAIPFVEINVNIAGVEDNKGDVKNAILQTIGYTTGMFVCFLIVTLMILRRYPAKITTFINGFTMLSFLISMIVLTIFTIQKI